jgi:ferritin-like metal-binding protein YciE
MSTAEQKIVQYLNEAHAMEQGLVRVLQEQIAMVPRGRFRQGLERHLTETRDHSERVGARLSQLGQGGNPIQFGIGLVERVIGQAIALGKAPVDLLRGSGGEEKVLKNAKDACAAESLEIATYTALERLAEAVGDRRTAELARSICADEQRMLERLLDEMPRLTDGVVRTEVRGEDSFALSETGAADASRSVARSAKRTASRTGAKTKRTAKRASARAKRATSDSKRTKRTTAGTAGSGKRASQRKAGSGSGRSQVTGRGTSPARQPAEHSEPWPGYDGLNVEEVRTALDRASRQQTQEVRKYERAHSDRTGVIEKAEQELTRT